MQLYTLDPLIDSRWDELVASHPCASVFHHKGWLKALAATYGYRPLVVTSTPGGMRLADGIAFCEVKSWITGKRLVSLPFSDHSEPLWCENSEPFELTEWMRTECRAHSWEYIELRPVYWKMGPESLLVTAQSFCSHVLDLTPTLEELFNNMHKNCIQRRVKRAEHGQLEYEKGDSEELLDELYRLLMITRKRHQLLPQPRAWFQNVLNYMKPNVAIRLARKDGVAIAAILTLQHRRTVVYKYGCSDAQNHHLGGMPFLMWKMIEESKIAGAEQIDFGRSDLDNDGLIEFKNRLGATRSQMTYLRYPEDARRKSAVESYLPAARRLFSILPPSISSMAGRVAYRHIG